MDQETLDLWNEMNDRLIHFVNQKVRDKELAKDIVQDVFVKVFSNINTLKNKDKIVSWIFQITRNEVNTYFRNQKYESSSEDLPETETIDKNLTSEFSQCIVPMIESMPEKYSEALKLTEINKMSQKELAEHLNISYSGAKSRVQRGREMLKTTLQDCCIINTDKYGNVIDYQVRMCQDNCD
ncbi:MAG TPA: RNA polymerase sigma factor SigZ [Bacteroidetes bacterium]|nr:RNA polymerase sigma factor SigZ [Bacteroidota bacterium]